MSDTTYFFILYCVGYFNVSIPDLQLGVTSQMTITVKPPPRTNVVLTMYGNNLVFVPPSVTFLPGVDVVRVDVTPIIQRFVIRYLDHFFCQDLDLPKWKLIFCLFTVMRNGIFHSKSTIW
jgi:hypothetical protein